MKFDWGLLINSFLVAMILFYLFAYPKLRRKEKYERRRNDDRSTIRIKPPNPNDKPGKSELCLQHLEKMSKVQTEVVELRRDVDKLEKKNDKSHELIFKKIDDVKDELRRR